MRCKYYDDFWGICCNGYSEYCEDDCPYEDWKECNCFCGESVKKKNKITPCYMCDNARLNNELTEENDFSSCGIGEFIYTPLPEGEYMFEINMEDGYNSWDIGKVIFFSKKDAEKTLKERICNGTVL